MESKQNTNSSAPGETAGGREARRKRSAFYAKKPRENQSRAAQEGQKKAEKKQRPARKKPESSGAAAQGVKAPQAAIISPATPENKKRGRPKTLKTEHEVKNGKITIRTPVITSEKIKIIPLGGLDEIGKNMTVFEYKNEMVIVDCGMSFPDDDMPGVDFVIPDTAYLKKNKDKIHGIFLTHGHEDHIGALPFFLRELPVPVYGTKLTLGIVTGKLKEYRLEKSSTLLEVPLGGKVKAGSFEIEFIRTNHSIADSAALAIKTPAGIIIHTGDFKIDVTPIEGRMIDLVRLGELGNEGVLALMSDSTNVERQGFAMSEKKVGASLDNIFIRGMKKRLIVTTFASNVHRVQQVINTAVNHGRKIAIVGRSMENIVNVAMTLGYMNIPERALISIDTINNYPPEKIVIITTGSQGEPMSALYRMAFSEHKKVEIGINDLVVMSASPIPGNEKLITKVINELFRAGAEVAYDSVDALHVSGHACQEELKLMLALTRPRYFIPVHGEYRHLKKHAEIARQMDVAPANIFILENGSCLEIDSQSGGKLLAPVQAGKILVDGLGVGDVGNVVLRDRMHLAQDGLIVVVSSLDSHGNIVAGPDIVSRGFVYVKESDELMNGIKNICRRSIEANSKTDYIEWQHIKNAIRDDLSSYLYEKTKRRPMILPVLMEV